MLSHVWKISQSVLYAGIVHNDNFIKHITTLRIYKSRICTKIVTVKKNKCLTSMTSMKRNSIPKTETTAQTNEMLVMLANETLVMTIYPVCSAIVKVMSTTLTSQ